MAFPSDWKHFFEATTQPTAVSGDNSDFPAYFDLANAPSGFWSKVQSIGGDIRVTDANDNLIPHEVAFIDAANNQGSLWCKLAVVDDNNQTTVRVWYDNPNASTLASTDGNGRNAVWTNGFGGVWHFKDEPPNNLIDATGSGSNGNTSGLPSSILADGKLGAYYQFGGGEFVIAPGSGLRPSVGWGHATWVRATGGTVSGDYNNVGWSGFWESSETNVAALWTTTNNKLTWAVVLETDTGRLELSSNSPRDNDWHLVRVQYESDNRVRLYIDGTNAATSSQGGAPKSTFSDVTFGGYSNSTGISGKWDISEVQIDGARSANWIATEYSNQDDPAAFWSVGVEQATSVDLAVQDAAHKHVIESAGLTQQHDFAIDGAAHAHAVETGTFTQVHDLITTGAVHAHALDVTSFTQAHNFAVEGIAHVHTAEETAFAGLLIEVDGLQSGTKYYAYLVQEDAEGFVSEVTPTGEFITSGFVLSKRRVSEIGRNAADIANTGRQADITNLAANNAVVAGSQNSAVITGRTSNRVEVTNG